MIHREEWVLNIFIQHQNPVQMDTYKRQNKQENLQEIEEG